MITTNGVTHNFQTQLAESLRLSDEPSWVKFYQEVWPEMLCCVRIDANSKWQRCGIDRMVLLPDGQQFMIDEKKRMGTYDDFLCEEWSVVPDNGGPKKVGWTLDCTKRCDFVAYAIQRLGKCHLLPFEILRRTAETYLAEWKQVKFAYPKKAENNGYDTINCSVTWNRLYDDMRRTCQRQFGVAPSLVLPPCDNSNGQFVFNWKTP